MSAVKIIYAGIRALEIDDEDDRRDLFERITGKRHLREMTASEKEGIVAELRRQGFRSQSPRRQIDGPYAKKLQALWISGWNLGLVRNREDAALIAFVKRQTGIDSTRWLRDPAAANKVIEALKDWLTRDGGVMWGNTNGCDWLAENIAKVAWAQWRKLYPTASLRDTEAFRSRISAILGRDAVILGHLKAADWREIANALGQAIRGGS